MKKNELKKLFLTILIIFSISLLFSCTPGNPPIDSGDIIINNKIKDVVKVKSVESVDYYKIIFENGIEKDFTVINGKDGISVVKSEINEEGELVLTYSNGNTINLGKVVGTNGENGTDGKDGVGIEEVKIDENYNLLITLTTGTTLNLGNIRGEQGINGISVLEAKITEDGSLIFKLSNNQEINVGNIMGKDGINGVGIKAIEFNQSGELIITLTDGNTINCGKIPTCKHSYGEYTILLEASCKQIGVKVRTCQLCQYEDLEFIELKDHTYIDSVIQPTCNKEGYTVHKCEVCGYNYEDTFTEKLAHQLKEVYYIVDTCTYKEILCICEKCGISKIITKNDNFHNYQDKITYPSCTAKGYTTHVCNVCNDTYIDTYVNELQHDLIHVPAKDATCTTDGNYAYDKCQRENCDYTTYIKIEKTGHNFVDEICNVCGENKHSEGLDYSLNSDKISYSVIGIGTCEDTDIVIANIYNGLSVTSIRSSAFSSCSSLTSITIPNSVTSIGEYAFFNCGSLTNVYYSRTIEDWCNITFSNSSSNPMYYAQHFYMLDENKEYKEVTEIEIPNTITKIGDYQFRGFNNVTNITIPNSVTSIGEYAFFNCGSLTNVYYSGTIEDWCNITFSDSTSNPMYYEQHFYMLDENNEYKEVTEIEIPNTITKIGDYQFRGFNNVTSITIPNSVTSIGYEVFYNCSSLTSITIPNSVTSIEEYAFSYCSSLTSIEIPNSVTSIGSSAFSGCGSLTIYCEAISKPSKWSSKWNIDVRPVYWGVTKEEIIEQNGIQYLIIDGNVTITRYIGNDTKFDIPKTITVNGTTYNVTCIEEYAFSYCSSLTSITIPNSVTSIGEYAFYNCYSLTIYCEATSKPSGWDYYWNSSNRPVFWGVTKE